MMKSILVGLGGTPFPTVAIRRSVELARLHDAQLTGASVVDVNRLAHVGPVPLGAGTSARALREHRLSVTREHVEAPIAELESTGREAGISVRILREQGDPFELMVSCCRHHDATVFGLRTIFEYGVLGEIEYDPGDVLTRLITGGVRPIIAFSERYRPIQRVLIAYSGSMESAETMRRLVQLRPWPDAALRIVAFQHPEDEAKALLANAAEYWPCPWLRTGGRAPLGLAQGPVAAGGGQLAGRSHWRGQRCP